MQTSFIPTMKAKLYRKSSYNSAGEYTFEASLTIGIAPVTLKTVREQTSVRADTSGSQSRADVDVFDGRVLVHPKYNTLKIGDQLEVINPAFAGIRYTIAGMFPRFDMAGALHHYQVELIL